MPLPNGEQPADGRPAKKIKILKYPTGWGKCPLCNGSGRCTSCHGNDKDCIRCGGSMMICYDPKHRDMNWDEFEFEEID